MPTRQGSESMSKGTGSGSMSVREAGRLGGVTVKEKYGPNFYQEIGKKGGEARKMELGPQGYAEMGRKGGEVVSQDREHMAAIGRRGGENSHGGKRSSRRSNASSDSNVNSQAEGLS